jgi:hypothetical protein
MRINFIERSVPCHKFEIKSYESNHPQRFAKVRIRCNNKMEDDQRNIVSKAKLDDDITIEIPSQTTCNQELDPEIELTPEEYIIPEKSCQVYGDRDILNGRGIIRHIANRVFRIFIDLHIHEYFHTPFRDEKSRIIEECLYDLIVAGYRFWSQNQNGRLIEQDLSTCRSKVCCLQNKSFNIFFSFRFIHPQLSFTFTSY